MNARYIIGGVIIIVFIAWGATAFINTTVAYVSFEDALKSKTNVQVAGHIDFNTVNFDSENNQLAFTIYEMDPKDPAKPERMRIVYKGVVPGNFDQATSIVAVGKTGDEGFVADNLLVKCPSKYQGADYEEKEW